MINLTGLAVALIAVCAGIITKKAIPWIKSKVDESNLNRIAYWTKIAIAAAEQKMKNGSIKKEERFKYAQEFLEKRGYKLDFNEIEALIEAGVHDLPNWLEAQVEHIAEFNNEELEENI